MYARGVQAGDIIGDRYVVERHIGRGGMGYVVAANHIGFGDAVAIKILLPEDASQSDTVERFLREGRVARQLQNPHVVRITDVGTLHSGAPYMVMEYLEGRDLAALLRDDGPLPVEQAVDLVLQACEALAEAHSKGIVHRDLKPSNLFLTRGVDGQPMVKILDFGIAKSTTGVAAETLTSSKSMIGSGPYMSPEQLESARNVDLRSDVWALGVLVYELISGKQPFEASSLPQVFFRIMFGEPTPLQEVLADAPDGLGEVLGRCLRQDRDERFQTIPEFAAAIAPFASPRGRASVTFIRSLPLPGEAPPTSGTASPREVVPDEIPTTRVDPLPPGEERPAADPEGTTAGGAGVLASTGLLEMVVGHSDDPDSSSAVDEVLEACTAALAGRLPRAAILMAGIDHDPAVLLQRIAGQWPGLPLIGCTTDGEVSSVGGFQEDSVALLMLLSDRLEFAVGLGTGVADDTGAAARAALAEAREGLGGEPTLCLATPASLIVSGVRVLDALNEALGGGVPVFGGTAGDQLRLECTWQFRGTEVVKDGLPVMLIRGPVRYAAGISSGWRPIGTKGVVTKVQGNMLIEIDGQRASDFYIERIGQYSTPEELHAMVVSYPLAVFEGGSGDFYLRSTFTVDLMAGTCMCLGDVPEGATVQIANGSRDDVLAGSSSSIEAALEAYPGDRPTGVLVFSCAGRRMLLGDRIGEEVERIRARLPSDLPVFGFYTYGELAPLAAGEASKFHNMTCISVVLGE